MWPRRQGRGQEKRVCSSVVASSEYASKMALTAAILMLMGTIGFFAGQPGGARSPVPTYGFQVVRSFPHDRTSFTQGLIVRDGFFFEEIGRASCRERVWI